MILMKISEVVRTNILKEGGVQGRLIYIYIYIIIQKYLLFCLPIIIKNVIIICFMLHTILLNLK